MENPANENVESRRDFLKKSVYAAPALVALGSLNVYGSNSANSKGVTDSKGIVVRANSSLKCNTGSGSSGSSAAPVQNSSNGNSMFGDDKAKGNNGFGNGDQDAPGNSLNNNNAENSQGSNNGQSKKNSEED